MSDPAPLSRLSRCAVYPAAALRVETGALMGDPIGAVEDVVAGDIYTLSDAAGARDRLADSHQRRRFLRDVPADHHQVLAVIEGGAVGGEGDVTP